MQEGVAKRAVGAAGRAALVRAGTFPLITVCVFLTARLVILRLGASGYALVALLVALPALVPFTDFGVGAAITTAVAEAPSIDDDHARRVLVTAFRVLTFGGAALAACAYVLFRLDVWTTVVGINRPDTGAAALTFCLGFALTLPFSIGTRVLIGAGRVDLAVLTQTAAAPVTLAFTAACWALRLPLPYYVAAPCLGFLVSYHIGIAQCRRVVGFRFTHLLRDFVSGMRGAPVLRVAVPMAVITLTQAIALQSDRLVLAHVGTQQMVAEYSVAAQVFTPVLSVVAVAGTALWPVFARQRADGRIGREAFVKVVAAFLGAGVLLGTALAFGGPFVGGLIGGHAVTESARLYMWFGAILVITAVHYPGGMLLTDAAGLRFQAALTVVMAAANVLLSIPLSRALGAVGPVIASFATLTAIVVVPVLARALAVAGGIGDPLVGSASAESREAPQPAGTAL